MVGKNVLKLTEIAYIPLYTSIYLLIPMKHQNKICTAVREGSRSIHTNYWGKKNQHFLRGQRSKNVVFLYLYWMNPYNIPRESPFFKLQGDVIYFTKRLKMAKLHRIKWQSQRRKFF